MIILYLQCYPFRFRSTFLFLHWDMQSSFMGKILTILNNYWERYEKHHRFSSIEFFSYARTANLLRMGSTLASLIAMIQLWVCVALLISLLSLDQRSRRICNHFFLCYFYISLRRSHNVSYDKISKSIEVPEFIIIWRNLKYQRSSSVKTSVKLRQTLLSLIQVKTCARDFSYYLFRLLSSVHFSQFQSDWQCRCCGLDIMIVGHQEH